MPEPKVIEHGLAPPDHPIYKTGVAFCRTLKSILAEAEAEAEAAARDKDGEQPVQPPER
jgi:exonuclease VII small subunit